MFASPDFYIGEFPRLLVWVLQYSQDVFLRICRVPDQGSGIGMGTSKLTGHTSASTYSHLAARSDSTQHLKCYALCLPSENTETAMKLSTSLRSKGRFRTIRDKVSCGLLASSCSLLGPGPNFRFVGPQGFSKAKTDTW